MTNQSRWRYIGLSNCVMTQGSFLVCTDGYGLIFEFVDAIVRVHIKHMKALTGSFQEIKPGQLTKDELVDGKRYKCVLTGFEGSYNKRHDILNNADRSFVTIHAFDLFELVEEKKEETKVENSCENCEETRRGCHPARGSKVCISWMPKKPTTNEFEELLNDYDTGKKGDMSAILGILEILSRKEKEGKI